MTGSSAIAGDERELLAQRLPAYRLDSVLGRGAFAVVYGATHVQLNREVAIKRLSAELLPDRDARERFGAEARLLASLDHPHVVRVYDYVESEDVCALVLERLYGGTLADRMRVGSLPAATSCAITVAVLHGLEHAHQRGVLHRDIKPANLLFGERDLIKVADFGIAKVIGAQGARLTATSGTLGTPAYMAPEQVQRAAGPLSPATDLWSVGAVLYELLGGEPPFSQGDEAQLVEVLMQRVHEDVRPLRSMAPAVPAELESVVMRALEREPGRRFQTAAAFADELAGAAESALGRGSLRASGIPIHPTEPAPSSAPTITDPGEWRPPATTVRPNTRIRSRRRALLGAGGLLAAGLAAVAVALISTGSGSGGALADLPPLPPGWPAKLVVGHDDAVRSPAQLAASIGSGSLLHGGFGGDAAARQDWSHQNNPSDQFAIDAAHAGLFPFVNYYEARALGRNGKDDANITQLKQTLANRRLMVIYWNNARAFLKGFGRANVPVAVSLEPSMWGMLEQDLKFTSGQPSDLTVSVASSGLPELKGQSDDLIGFASAWQHLRDLYAPKVLLGPLLDFFGTNLDLGNAQPTQKSVIINADEQGQFFLNLIGPYGKFDFAAFEDNEGGSAGSDPRAVYPTDAQKANVLTWIKEFVHRAGVRATLENVPAGNTLMRTIDDRRFHYHDYWAQWLMGDKGFTRLRQFRDAGLILLQFAGGSDPTSTCACDAAHDGITNGGRTGIVSHSVDDDGGYLASRINALRAAGGLTLR